MKKILFFDLHSLRNDEYSQFQTDVHKLIILQTAIKLGIVNLIPNYESALTVLAQAMQAEQGSAITKTITESDAFRDQLEFGFKRFVESQLNHFDPAVQEAAVRIDRILGQYGDLRHLSYNEESSAITNRNMELKTNYAADLLKIGATEWFENDDAANTAFATHFGERANEEASRLSGNVRAARALVDPAYYAIVNQVNALALINGETVYAEFIDQVNYYVNYYKSLLAARKGRKKSVAPAVAAE